MRLTLAFLALATAALANPRPQGVTAVITPTAVPPGGCSETRQGDFTITVVNVTTNNPVPSSRELLEKLEIEKRQNSGLLTLTLNNGILLDQAGRTGYIASNYQFQFDKPPQHGSIYTAGFSICANGSLALGGSSIFYQCLSGSFYNLYDRHWAAQCVPVYIEIIGGAGSLIVTSTPPPTPVTETTTTPSSTSQTAVGIGGGSGGNSTTTASGIGGSGSNSTATGTSGSASGKSGSSASATGSGSGSSASGSGSGSGSGSPSSASSSGGAQPVATSGPQALVAFAAGIFGAMAML